MRKKGRMLTFSIILPMPPAVMPRPPQIWVASSAVSRLHFVMNLEQQLSFGGRGSKLDDSLLQERNWASELV